MGQRWRSDGKLNLGDESVAVIIVSSSDDEAANEDLSLKMQREVKCRSSGNGHGEPVQFSVIDLSSTSSDEVEVAPDLPTAAVVGGGLVAPPEVGTKKKRRRKSRKKKNGSLHVDAPVKEEKLPVAADSVEVDEAFDNVVLRRLCRGPRYFDPGERILETCYNCREEGHAAVNCTMKRRQKPCFVCGRFGHYANQCPQGRDCYICKRRGHLAKSCPDKHEQIAQDSMICLRCGNVGRQRCGDIGHDILSCTNDYAPDDLKWCDTGGRRAEEGGACIEERMQFASGRLHRMVQCDSSNFSVTFATIMATFVVLAPHFLVPGKYLVAIVLSLATLNQDVQSNAVKLVLFHHQHYAINVVKKGILQGGAQKILRSNVCERCAVWSLVW